MVSWWGWQITAYPQDPLTTKHLLVQAHHARIFRIPLHFHHPYWEELQPPRHCSLTTEGWRLFENYQSPPISWLKWNSHRAWRSLISTLKETYAPNFLEPDTSVLKHSPKLVVLYKLHATYLHQPHEGTNHSGITRNHLLLFIYWWKFKNCDIKACVNSCDSGAKCKGNYGKHAGPVVTVNEARDHLS